MPIQHKPLGAVQHPTIAVALGGGFDMARVVMRLFLQRQGENRVATDQPGEIGLLLRFIAGEVDGTRGNQRRGNQRRRRQRAPGRFQHLA